MTTTTYFDKYELNITYLDTNTKGGPRQVHYGCLTFKMISYEEVIRRAQAMKQILEPEGLEVQLTGWTTVGRFIPLD